jgi:hypothetical protein
MVGGINNKYYFFSILGLAFSVDWQPQPPSDEDPVLHSNFWQLGSLDIASTDFVPILWSNLAA